VYFVFHNAPLLVRHYFGNALNLGLYLTCKAWQLVFLCVFWSLNYPKKSNFMDRLTKKLLTHGSYSPGRHTKLLLFSSFSFFFFPHFTYLFFSSEMQHMLSAGCMKKFPKYKRICTFSKIMKFNKWRFKKCCLLYVWRMFFLNIIYLLFKEGKMYKCKISTNPQKF
jgi:hypothetical protein